MASHITPIAVSYISQASRWPDLDSPHACLATMPSTSWPLIKLIILGLACRWGTCLTVGVPVS
jgi:hypothetical protein